MLISICTCTARRGFVEKQAQFIANQKINHQIEWVLVDFAYEERKEIVKKLSADLNLKIIHTPNIVDDRVYFRDIARNRNKALKYASGDFIIFLDDFSVIDTDFVEKHLTVMKENAISCGLMHRLDQPTTTALVESIPSLYSEVLKLYPGMFGVDFRDRNGQNYRAAAGISYTGNLGFPRVAFERLNGFDPRLEGALEDCDFGLRADRMGFATYFNAKAYTINLSVAGHPYVYSFDHIHDCEPFIKNGNNQFRGDDTLTENEFMTVEFFGSHRIATCKKCGAKGMIDGNQLISHKLMNNEIRVPLGLHGGLDTIKRIL